MNLIKIASQDGKHLQHFIRTVHHESQSQALQLGQMIIDHKPSTVAHDHSAKAIIKLIKPRNWKERAKLFWGHSRVHKEVKGARLFNQLGLRTPDIYEMGIAVPFFFNSAYIGYYVMSDLNNQGLVPALDLFRNPTTPVALRQTVISNICDGLNRLKSRNVVFTDFHLSNVYSDDKGNITWIDTGVSHYFSDRKMKSKLQNSVLRFLRFHKDFSFHPQEVSYVKAQLLNDIVTTAEGSAEFQESFAEGISSFH